MGERLLSIGELADRTGVATSALRYYEELGLIEPTMRVSGRRRYASDVIGVVGVVLLLRDLGFSLEEIREAMAERNRAPHAWRDFARSKLEALDARIAELTLAREALAHTLEECESEDIAACPTFQAVVAARAQGIALPASDPH